MNTNPSNDTDSIQPITGPIETEIENFWVLCVNLNAIADDKLSIANCDLWVLAPDVDTAERLAVEFLGGGWVVAWSLCQSSADDLAGYLVSSDLLSPDNPVVIAPV